ncbi:MAG: transposase family protein [Verrucomicrobiae bacterium]|nr:transposase family protein [Verrucomicrobiae bacterium]
MQDTQLFSLALGLDGTRWFVKEVRLDPRARRLDLELDFKLGTRFLHPITSQPSPVHDTARKSWRHMNFFQFECHLHARVPRVSDPEGVGLIPVPWARPDSGFTLLMEALMVLLSRTAMAVNEVARLVGEPGGDLLEATGGWVEFVLPVGLRQRALRSDVPPAGEFLLQFDHQVVEPGQHVVENRPLQRGRNCKGIHHLLHPPAGNRQPEDPDAFARRNRIVVGMGEDPRAGLMVVAKICQVPVGELNLQQPPVEPREMQAVLPGHSRFVLVEQGRQVVGHDVIAAPAEQHAVELEALAGHGLEQPAERLPAEHFPGLRSVPREIQLYDPGCECGLQLVHDVRPEKHRKGEPGVAFEQHANRARLLAHFFAVAADRCAWSFLLSHGVGFPFGG